MALTQHAHDLICQHLAGKPCKVAIDATCGNGHDSEFLLNLGFEKIFAFDIQQQALDLTKERLSPGQAKRSQLILDGHQNMASYVTEQADCIMFNLGYLPLADKKLTTESATTLAALTAATNLLSEHGIISIMCYPGHPAGKQETQVVQAWTATLDSSWRVRSEVSESPKPTAPLLLLLSRK